jgi:hypothetical protein
VTLRDGAKTDVDELVPFATSRTNFGGIRHWLTCLHCRRRVGVLYGGQDFRGRTCHGLHYSSQYEPFYERVVNEADKLRARVGGSRGAFERNRSRPSRSGCAGRPTTPSRPATIDWPIPPRPRPLMTPALMRGNYLSCVLAFLFLLSFSVSHAADNFIIFQSTTSTQNSGLLEYILSLFIKKTGIEVRVVAVGTGQALKNAMNGDGEWCLSTPRKTR